MRRALIALALIACDSPGGGTGQTVDQEAVCLESEDVAAERWLCIYDIAPRPEVLRWCADPVVDDPYWVPCLHAFEAVECGDDDAFAAAWELCLEARIGE